MADIVGMHMGSYRLTRLIGSGGFAEVYLGEHLHLGTLAAIKVLHAQLADADSIEAFRTEARTIVRLEHPHIIRLLDFGIEDDMPFFVMHYASHGSLRDHHPKGSILPLATIVSYIKQAADALQYAHNEKIIHRDVKPENMLLSHRNEIVLSDFGIAIEAHNTHSMSLQHEAGTIPYMAPEQIQSQARPASDQYSLGVIVYEWLSGTRPFEGSYLQIATQHLLVPPPPLREKIPSILASVEQIVMTALAKEPKHRFPTVQAFALALENAWQDTEQPSVNVSHSISSILPPSSVSVSLSQRDATSHLSEHSIQQGLSYDQTTAPLPPASFSKPPSPGTIPIFSQTASLSQSSLPLPDQQATSILSIQHQKEPQPSGTPLIGASYPLSPTVNLPIQVQLQTTSAKNTYTRKGISLGLIALVLIAGGVISYLSLGLSNNISNSGRSNTSSIYYKSTGSSRYACSTFSKGSTRSVELCSNDAANPAMQ